ncbi:MAG: FliA/WhiG family RNA polymerase sigma factor [Phycisphaerales bacterium]|nr:MAG: FliA/WhiG family RNA polymerase sigma factor [Phycisphaerales bacterium]
MPKTTTPAPVRPKRNSAVPATAQTGHSESASRFEAPLAEGHVENEQDIQQIWRDYRRLNSEVLRTRLIVHYMNSHVRKIAARLHATLPRQVDLEDLVQQGYIGLVESMSRFDIDRDIKFETFSSQRIYGAMQDYLRKIDPTPRPMRKRTKQMQALVENFRKKFGRSPTDDEVREQLELSSEEFRRVLASSSAPMTLSLTGRPGRDENGDDESMPVLEDDDGVGPLRTIEESGLKQWITRGLDQRDRLILILYYYEQLTMKEIGRTLGISESRVSQRLDSILQCLRSRFAYSEALEEFVMD